MLLSVFSANTILYKIDFIDFRKYLIHAQGNLTVCYEKELIVQYSGVLHIG